VCVSRAPHHTTPHHTTPPHLTTYASLPRSASDAPEERDRKLRLIAIYNHRLDEREARRAFVLDRGLLNVRRQQVRERVCAGPRAAQREAAAGEGQSVRQGHRKAERQAAGRWARGRRRCGGRRSGSMRALRCDALPC
jgi:hypothetical protein